MKYYFILIAILEADLRYNNNNRYVKLFVRSSKLLRHYFCAQKSQLHKKVKLQERPIYLFVNRSRSFMDQ